MTDPQSPLICDISKLMSQMKGKSGISVEVMLKLQMAMNKFSQITDLGSTTISLYNQSVKTAISNILR